LGIRAGQAISMKVGPSADLTLLVNWRKGVQSWSKPKSGLNQPFAYGQVGFNKARKHDQIHLQKGHSWASFSPATSLALGFVPSQKNNHISLLKAPLLRLRADWVSGPLSAYLSDITHLTPRLCEPTLEFCRWEHLRKDRSKQKICSNFSTHWFYFWFAIIVWGSLISKKLLLEPKFLTVFGILLTVSRIQNHLVPPSRRPSNRSR
jgi:hypothetical protein